MSWIAISDTESQHFSRDGLEPGAKPKRPTGALLHKGSLVVETRLSPEGRPQNLLAYKVRHPAERSISLQAIPGGGIVLIRHQDGETTHAVVGLDSSERADLLRITYSWNAPKKWARLAIERPETGWSTAVSVTDPKPMHYEDIKIMTLSHLLVQVDDDVEFYAVSDQIEPLGPMPTLHAKVPILGQGQYRLMRDINPGERVQTLEHSSVPVLGHVARTVPARGSFRPVRLRAPYFGLQQDIIVAPDQKLVVSQPLVEYMFGCEAVLVPARHLVNGTSAIWSDNRLFETFHQLVLPNHQTLIGAGAALESLFLGRLRRKPERHAASLLAKVSRDRLPEHMGSAHQVLRPFEAITLIEQNAA